jgi:aspartyl-tRNA(Asn)/glutamyl-tRNA(Gln) amidotransferase subunit C
VFLQAPRAADCAWPGGRLPGPLKTDVSGLTIHVPAAPTIDSRLSTPDFFPAFHHKTGQLTGNSLFLLLMEVTTGLINNLANLARLQFSEDEKAAIRTDLQRMIAFVEKLQEVDTTGTEPLLHMTDVLDAYREDEVKGSMQKATALANAPDAGHDYFRVPKVIKK